MTILGKKNHEKRNMKNHWVDCLAGWTQKNKRSVNFISQKIKRKITM